MFKSVLKFLSEITDIDNRILQTVITLFRSPTKVVEAHLNGQALYIRPLRYALSTSSLFIVAQYLYELFTDPEIGKWWLPVRIDQADTQFRSLFEILFPFLILITVIPIAILVLKVLFHKKSLREITVIMLYAIAQLWLLLTLFVPILIVSAADGLIVLGCLIIVFVFFRNVWYGHIILKIGKWLVMTVLLIIWFYEVSLSITEIVLTGFLKDYTPPVITSPVAKPLKVINLKAAKLVMIQGDPINRTLKVEVGEKGVRASFINPNGSLNGETFLPGVDNIRKAICVTLESNVYGFLILTDSVGSAKSKAFLTSLEGKILYTKVYPEKMVLNGGGVLRGTILFMAGGRLHNNVMVPFIDVITLHFANDKLVRVNERNFLLPNPRQRFDDIYPVDSVATGLTLIASKYESSQAKASSSLIGEITNFSVLKINLDSAIVPVWENEIFHKTSMYSPRRDEAFHMIIDTTNSRILATYSLSNDSIMATQVFHLNGNGKLIWQQSISVNNLTFVRYLYSDKSGIYFCGSIESGINNPISTWGAQGLLGFISADGEKVSTIRFGKMRHGHQKIFDKLIVGDSIAVYCGNHRSGYLGEQTNWELLKFKNNFAEEP